MKFLSLLCAASLAAAAQFPLQAPSVGLSSKLSKKLLALHKDLVTTESISGHEGGVGDYLVKYFEKHDWHVKKQKVGSKRYNIYAYPGKSMDTEILLSSHIDTVPPFIKYSIRPDNDGEASIWGRGSVDAKACVAAQTIAALDLLESGELKAKDNPLALLFVVGEETGGDGMEYFSAHRTHNYSSIIFGEPTESKLAAGHKGLLGMKIDVQGRAAHSGYPWLGVSANEIMIKAAATLLYLQDQGGLPSSEKYGATTLNIGKITGGVAANVVAEVASADIALRLAAGTVQDTKQILMNALGPAMQFAKDKGGVFNVTITHEGYGPVSLDTDVDGFGAITVNYGTDVPNLKVPASTKRYLYGPGSILVAHGPVEHLKVSELEQAVVDYKKLIRHSLGLDDKH